jgi:hypothetical protein
MKNSKNIGTGNKNAQAALADINERIAELQQKRVPQSPSYRSGGDLLAIKRLF